MLCVVVVCGVFVVVVVVCGCSCGVCGVWLGCGGVGVVVVCGVFVVVVCGVWLWY